MLRSTLKKIRPVELLNSRIKAILQERRATRWQHYYEAEARRRRISVPTGPELQEALRQRIAPRRQNRPPVPKGKMHIFLAYGLYNWEAVLPTSLAPFGNVTTFEWRSLGFDDRQPDWLSRRDAMNRAMLEAFQQANARQPVDAVVGYISGYNTSPETLEQMARAGAVIFNFCFDDKLQMPGYMAGGRWHSPAGIAHVVDLNLSSAPESLVKYAMHGGLAMFWPEAAQPDIHHPCDVPFEFDVSFVGACYGWRPAFMRRLARLGVEVECFGKGWPNGPLSDAEMIRLYSRSRINLGCAGVGHSQKLMCLKGRDFEVPMSGGLYLTQDNPELKLVYDVGREIVTYRDASDCADTIRQLLADPDRAAAIRQAGRSRCLRDHTWESRWAQAFAVTGILEV